VAFAFLEFPAVETEVAAGTEIAVAVIASVVVAVVLVIPAVVVMVSGESGEAGCDQGGPENHCCGKLLKVVHGAHP
jgi:hypothetical protein